MQLVFDFPPVTRHSFDNFVVCTGNRIAFEFAQRLVGDAAEQILYLYGPPGTGKTHLLLAIGERLGSNGEGVPHLSCGASGELYPGSDLPERESPLVERFRAAPILLVDDIHLVRDTRSHREELWHLFNEFYQSGRKIVVTGALPPRELTSVDDHLISRLLWGLVARMDVSDDDSRRLILKKLADDRQIVLPDDVIAYLLIHVRRDLHSLTAAFEALVREALASGRKITLRLARETLER
jgi:chromosomal replication initiator protein